MIEPQLSIKFLSKAGCLFMFKLITQSKTTSFTLSQFLTEIKETIDRKFKGSGYWVRGELSDWKKNGAHYYGELIEFDEK